MKKRFLIFVSILLVMSFVFGCDSSYNSKNISVSDFYGQDKLTINLRVKKAFFNGHGVYFNRDESLEELKQFILNMNTDTETYTVQDYENSLFIKKETTIVTYYYYIYQLQNNSRKYIIFGLGATLYIPRSKQVSFMLPYQYFLGRENLPADTENSLDNFEMIYSFYENEEIEVKCQFSDFVEFYLGQKRVSTKIDEENQIITFLCYESNGQLTTYKNIYLKYSSNNDKNYVQFYM